ncbi:MAG: hypothetical protein L6R41_003588 [Letrouitia leprolyta]|nr:MAG: hypothetical protein L6R41_003588 [Letrouitia leprolyta]
MENLSIQDSGAVAGPNHVVPPGGPPQLPPQVYPYIFASGLSLADDHAQDLDKDDYIPEPFRKATAEEVHALAVKKNQATKRTDKVRQARLQELGFEAEHSGEVLF